MKADRDQGVAAPVHRLRQGLAVAATVVAIPVVARGLPTGFGGPFVLTPIPVALPLPALRAPSGFSPACVASGLGLLVWGLPGVMLGTFLFWPSALLLLLAAYADPRRRPVTARAAGVVGAAVTAVALAGCAASVRHFCLAPVWAPPHTYRAEISRGSNPPVGTVEGRLTEYGATHVWGSESDGGTYLDVRFPDGFSEPERAGLRSELARLPGISRVGLCSVAICG